MSKEQFPRSNYRMTPNDPKMPQLALKTKSDQRNYQTISIVYSFVIWNNETFQIVPDIVNDLPFKNLYSFATLFKLSNFWIFETIVDTITIYYFKLLSLLYRWCFLFFVSCAMVRSANIFWRSLRTDISSVPPWKRVILEDNFGFLDWSLLPQNTRFIVTFFYAFLYWKRSAYIVSVEGD